MSFKIFLTVTITIPLILIRPATAQLIPAENVVLHLSFDNNELVDQSTHKHDIISHQTGFATGISAEGLRLDGQNNYLEIPYSSTLEIPDQVSISMWYLHERQDRSSFYSLVEQSADEFGGHSRYGTWVFNQNSVMACVEPDVCPNGSTLCQRCITSTTLLEEGEWYHILSSYDGSSQKLYINGELDQNQNYSASTGVSVRQYPLTIGTDIYDGSPVYLRGTLDEIRLMNTALSEEQIQSLYQEFSTSSIHEDISLSDLRLYPMPTNDQIKIKSSAQIKKVEIYDLTGSLVKEQHGHSITDIAVNQLESGLYVIKLYNESHIESRKLIIQK